MSNNDLLTEIEEEFETASGGQRKADISLSGTGTEFSDSFDSVGGAAFFDVEFKDSAQYKIKAVGQTVEDRTIKFASDETPITHNLIDELEEGTYILNVEADESARWELDVYLTAPEPISLPYEGSGRGNDVIGPLSHSGFIRINATNYHTNKMNVKQPEVTGRSYLNSPSTSVESSADGQGTMNEQIVSTVDGYEKYPWLQIESNGKWEIEVDAHE